MKGSWDDERDPLAALRRGDRGPFEAFVHLEKGTLLGFFQRLGAELGEAEDLAQEVFLKLYRAASSYEPQAKFSSYVLRTARNAWIDRRRRRSARVESLSLSAGADGEPELLERLSADLPPVGWASDLREQQAGVRAAIRRLPQSHAEVIVLAFFQALPYTEIARLLDIPVGTVKSRVHHAVRKLRELLSEDLES